MSKISVKQLYITAVITVIGCLVSNPCLFSHCSCTNREYTLCHIPDRFINYKSGIHKETAHLHPEHKESRIILFWQLHWQWVEQGTLPIPALPVTVYTTIQTKQTGKAKKKTAALKERRESCKCWLHGEKGQGLIGLMAKKKKKKNGQEVSQYNDVFNQNSSM